MQSRDSRDGQTGSKEEAPKGASLPSGKKKKALGEFEPGEIVGGDYEIIEPIGRGAMGYVYKAKHTTMNAQYALKVLSGEQLTDVAWKRFRNEAQAIAKLQHPNIVGIFNFGLHEDNLPYYVMEFLEGENLLNKVLEYGPAPWQQALPIFVEVCAALGYAHRKGIVHRDVKPGNIIVLNQPDSAGARVKVVDFGIVKFSDETNPNSQKLTSMGEVCGSPTYMSPEQAAGDKVDPRSDVYSLGCSLFETLTGNLPFRGRNAIETMLMHQTATAPKLKAASNGLDFPENLEKVVAKMMAKAPMDRYQNMEALAFDLKAVLEGGELGGAIYTPSNRDTLKQEVYSQAARTRKLSTSEMQNEGEENSQPPKRFGAALAITTSRAKAISLPVRLAIALAAIAIITTVAMFVWNLLNPAAPGVKTTESSTNQKQTSDSSQKSSSGQKRGDKANDSPDASAKKILAGDPVEPSKNGLVDFIGSTAKLMDGADYEKWENMEPGVSLKDTKPFCHIEGSGKSEYRIFQFPEEFVLGYICTSGDLHGVHARGTCKFSTEVGVVFMPTKMAVKYPQYLKRFRADDILCVALLPYFNGDEVLKTACEIPGVKEIKVFDDKHLTKKCIPHIAKLKDTLQLLDWSNSSLDGADLARADCWDNLKQLYMNYSKNVSPLIAKIADSEDLVVLHAAGCKISREDVRKIATLKNLAKLDLSDNKLTNADLATLSTLPHLDTLEIANCGIYRQAIPVLKKFPALKHLRVNSEKYNNPNYTEIKTALMNKTAVY